VETVRHGLDWVERISICLYDNGGQTLLRLARQASKP
jgi:hypothetical protein